MRAAYLVKAMTPTNAPGAGDPVFPERARSRASRWARAPLATALPDRFCVVGLARVNGDLGRALPPVGQRVPDQLAVGPDPRNLAKAEARRRPSRRRGNALAARAGPRARAGRPDRGRRTPRCDGGVERLVVLGVDWTQAPEQAAASLGSPSSTAQRYSGHLGFVRPGHAHEQHLRDRAGFTTAEAEEAAALDPSAPSGAGRRVERRHAARGGSGAPGATPSTGLPGADLREHAWASALVDALWRGTAGYYISDILDPLAKSDAQVDADLREFVRRNVFACGPLPDAARRGAALRRAARRLRRAASSPGHAPEKLVHRVATLMRDIVTPAIASVPHLRRAGESQDVDSVLLALLQRTPVPWTFRFRPLTGPIERKNMSVRWDIANVWQRTWTTAMWAGLGVYPDRPPQRADPRQGQPAARPARGQARAGESHGVPRRDRRPHLRPDWAAPP